MHKRLPKVAVLLESSHEVSRAMLRGVFRYLRAYGPWQLSLFSGGAGDQRLPDFRLWKCSGIIARIPSARVAREIAAARLPTVLIDPMDAYLAPTSPLVGCSRVACDSDAVGRSVGDYLLGKGFKSFAFVDDVSGCNWSRWRREAFVARLAEAGAACAVYPLPDSRGAARWEVEQRAMSRWLRKLPFGTAVFAATDARGRQVLSAALAASITVPYQLAVVGVNNDPMICETSLPPLTSMGLDAEGGGYAAAELLGQIFHRRRAPQKIVRFGPTEMAERDSSRLIPIADELVIRALEYIRINAGLSVRANELAGQLGVTSRCLEKHFAAAGLKSVIDEIQSARIQAVRAMVVEGSLPFLEIAARCGFTNASYLGALFREHFGVTMSDLRKRFARAGR